MDMAGLNNWETEEGGTAGEAGRQFKWRGHLAFVAIGATIGLIFLVQMISGVMACEVLRAQEQLDFVRESEVTARAIERWDRQTTQMLQVFQGQPGMAGMNPQEQLPLIQRIKEVYGYMDIVRITGADGISKVRSDGITAMNYGDREWFSACMAGAPIYRQLLITKTGDKAAINFSTPISSREGKVVGVLSTVTRLSAMAGILGVSNTEVSRRTIVVDERGRGVIDSGETIDQPIWDLSQYPPVEEALRGRTGELVTWDAEGREWYCHTVRLGNGWVVVSQMAKGESVASGRMMRATYCFSGGTALVMTTVAWLLGRRPLQAMESRRRKRGC